MDLVTLDYGLQPHRLVQDYDSLIWTERYNTVGDFQLTTGLVAQFMNELPQGTRLSLRDTNVIMEVETHRIERRKGQPEKLTITGRSLESVLDRRVSLAALSSNEDFVLDLKTPSDMAYAGMYMICVNGILDPEDIFPASEVTFQTPWDYMATSGPVKKFVMPRGNLLASVLGLIQTSQPIDYSTIPVTPAVQPHGIRAVRPGYSDSRFSIQIYYGTDRSSSVYFDASRDLLDDGTYLFSQVGSSNVAYVMGAKFSAQVKNLAAPPSGFARRVMLVDGTTSGVEEPDILRQQANLALAESQSTALFDGSINQDISPYLYKVHYDLGDIVRLVGDYGFEERARVTEYIRSDDASGLKSYPTLTTVNTWE